MLSGAQAIAAILEKEHIDHIFHLPGSQMIDVLNAFFKSSIRNIMARHEQGASFMAEGYARVKKSPTLCMSTAGPGATNLISGIAASFKSATPVIAFTGLHDSWLLEKDSFHEIDQVALFKPITKWSYMVTDTEKIPEILYKAFRIALSGRPGPVHLCFPRDIVLKTADFKFSESKVLRAVNAMGCEPEIIDEIIVHLKKAKRPVFLAGNDIVWRDATPELIKLADLLSIPVTTTCDHLSAFPTIHPLGMGPIGRNRSDAANLVLSKADLLIAIGAKFDYQSTRFNYEYISKNSKIIQVSLDPEEIGRIYPTEIGLTADVKFVLRDLLRKLDDNRQFENEWNLEALGKIKDDWKQQRLAEVDLESIPIKPQAIVKILREVLAPNAVIVVDGGNYAKHVRRHFDTYEPNTFYYTDNFGAVGSAFPMAMGVKLASPKKQVLCLIGDGGFMFNDQEIETAVRENINICTVVFNDHGFGNVRAYQTKKLGERYCCDFENPDFGKLARLFKAHGEQVASTGDLRGALERGLNAGKPSVVDVIMSSEDLSTPGFL